jgi:hypothetical protein
MQKAQHLIGILHVTNPCIPRTVFYSVPKASKHENNGKDRVGWMYTDNHVGDDFAGRSDGGYTQLSKAHVYGVVEEGGESVAYKWGEEYEGNYCVVYVVVDFKLCEY